MITFSKLGQYGQLGNQLWQISATVGLALRNKRALPIFPRWKYESDFCIPIEYFSYVPIRVKNIYNEPHFHYAPIPFSMPLDLVGYFQAIAYWIDQEQLIRSLLSFNPIKYQHELIDAISLHVRRTDYLIHHDCYVQLNRSNYYDKALDILNASKVLIFSDDLAWCKENFKGNMFEFSEGNNEVMDMFLMSKCMDNICANSSYSWWASYLNNNINKKIIAPKNWFGPKLAPSHNTKDLIPSSWQII